MLNCGGGCLNRRSKATTARSASLIPSETFGRLSCYTQNTTIVPSSCAKEQALERSHCRTNNTHLREGKEATMSSLGLWRKRIKIHVLWKANFKLRPSFFSRHWTC